MLDSKYLHVVLIQGLVHKDSKFLLGKRSEKELQMPGEWVTPGGRVERVDGGSDTIIIDTLKREIEEEVGVQIKDDVKLVGSGSFIRKDDYHVIVLNFLCEYDSGEPTPSDEMDEVAWMSMEEIKKNCNEWVVGVFEF